MESEAAGLEAWLKRGYHGTMSWMEQHFDKRLDPRLLVPGARSVVSLVCNCAPSHTIGEQLKVARYAYGEDYHRVIKDKLAALMESITDEIGEVQGRVFVDSAPVMERQWAARSGLGWLGKNSLLLNRELGSYFFLAELVIDLELTPDGPMKDYCGTCTACMDACPTDAIPLAGVVDASRCISYLTIELKDEIPATFHSKMEGWMFGCDICQEVCPWNRFARPHEEPRFAPSPAMSAMKDSDWKDLSEELFNELARKSPLKRARYEGLRRNIQACTGEAPVS